MATNITFHPGALHIPLAQYLALTACAGAVERQERVRFLGQRGLTIWLTGLSASGKVNQVAPSTCSMELNTLRL